MYTLVENFCLGLRRLELFARARSLRRGWVSVLAEGEEAHVPAVQAHARSGDTAQLSLSPEQLPGGGTNALGQELAVDRSERWDQDKWEAAMRPWLQNGRAVVPMTPGKFVRSLLLFPFLSGSNMTGGADHKRGKQRSMPSDQSRPSVAAIVAGVAVVAAAAAQRRSTLAGSSSLLTAAC
jgi:hypothetical protein